MSIEPQTPGQSLKKAGMDQISSHNSKTLEWVLLFIKQCRDGHLRTKNHDRVFTIEDLIHDYENIFEKKVPYNLAGVIGAQARAKDYVEEVGPYVQAKDKERHANKIPLCRWKLY